MNRRPHPRLAALYAAALLSLAACGDAPRHDPLPPGATVLAFGDSVTHGTGASRGEDFPSRLSTITGWTIVNAGVPGDTAAEARTRIHDALEAAQPALVIVELGGNDFLRRRPAAEVKEDLRHILRAVRDHGAVPVLVGVPEFSIFAAATGRLSESGIYRELAREEGVLLVDGVFADVLSDDSLRADRIHPNAAGYDMLAEGIAATLADSGLFRR